MRPKLAEVARLADVSEATVSRVVNARPGVAEDTRRRVLDVLSDLGYQDRPERSTGTWAVGISTPELENPIFAMLAQTIESRLAQHGILSFVCSSTAETVSEQDFLEHLLSIRAAGAIVINGRYAQPSIGYGPYVELRRRGLPVVLVNALHGEPPVPAVGVDSASAMQLAVQHLVALGHERIGLLIGPSRYSIATAMATGYRQAMTEHGLEDGDRLISATLFTFEGGQAGTARLLEAGVTGIVAGSDLMALGAISAVRLWGGSVPGDVSVIGFDGTPQMSYTDPPLTTLRQPIGRMAAAITSMLVAEINGATTPHTQIFRPELVVGGSTAPVRVGAAV
jgi:LacI family transcriptional regulator, repressor for deo operon, udp, cdd, tsx, nupC, and nupG